MLTLSEEKNIVIASKNQKIHCGRCRSQKLKCWSLDFDFGYLKRIGSSHNSDLAAAVAKFEFG